MQIGKSRTLAITIAIFNNFNGSFNDAITQMIAHIRPHKSIQLFAFINVAPNPGVSVKLLLSVSSSMNPQ